ncbi:MAG TPA: Cof-type HAD-IIB family hydrolase [Chthonomonadaceae bacterium]|nr:Cof-type HAD-IIB family hydrolase [Chthonomonadaceae bacterium]
MTAPARPQIRALFLDIDGTLVDGANTISPGVQKAIAAAREKGCEIVLCTGRTRYRTLPVAELLGPPLGYAITSNGGVVVHLGAGEVLYRRLLPIPVALEIVRAIVEAGAEPYVYEDSDVPGEEGARVLFHPDLPVGPWATFPRYRPHATLLEDLPFAPVSVSCFGAPEKMRPLAARLSERLSADVSIIQSGTEYNWGVEVFVSGVSKRLGLETVAARLDVAREETLAIGDHFNDLEVLRWAGVGVAMGNALPEVLAAADWVTASLEEDGVARAIERFIL